MLAPEAQAALDKLKPGEIAEPVRLLQGVAVMRLDGRNAALLNGFEQVRQRASELEMRERGDAAWQQLITKLRKQNTITTDQKTFKALFTAPSGEQGIAKH